MTQASAAGLRPRTPRRRHLAPAGKGPRETPRIRCRRRPRDRRCRQGHGHIRDASPAAAAQDRAAHPETRTPVQPSVPILAPVRPPNSPHAPRRDAPAPSGLVLTCAPRPAATPLFPASSTGDDRRASSSMIPITGRNTRTSRIVDEPHRRRPPTPVSTHAVRRIIPDTTGRLVSGSVRS